MHGLVHFSLIEGGMRRSSNGDFLSEIDELLLEEGVTLLIDNAPSHSEAGLRYDHHHINTTFA